MNEENLRYLQDQVLYTGFGDTLDNELKEKIQQQPETFSLNYQTEYGKDKVDVALHFSQSKQEDSNMYFFNSYKVNLKREGESDMEQQFYINKGSNITLKEAYNLMCGRAVNKNLTNREGELYNTWLQIDFKQTNDKGNYQLKYFNENYGYNLEDALGKYPLKELEREDYKATLVESLKKGNPASATLVREGMEDQKVYAVANPKFKSIILYDSNMQRLGRKRREKQDTTKKQDQKESQTVEGDESSPTAKKKTRKKARAV